MRTTLAVLLLIPHIAIAESTPEPVSQLDEARLFNTTEAYRLDPGTYRLELRGMSGEPYTKPTLELRAELGLTKHVQINIAQDLSTVEDHTTVIAAAPIGIRYSLAGAEDEVLGNPAVEATVIPRTNAPSRAQVKVLAAEQVMPKVVLAMNAYLEQNLDRRTFAGVDGAFGMTGGVSYALIPGLVRIGGEGVVGEAQYGLPYYTLVAGLGPNAMVTRGPFALTATVLANLATPSVSLEPKLTLGATF